MTDFTHAGYRRMLRRITAAGRSIVPFRAAPPSGPCVVLRHDIDFSIEKAHEMAEFDREMGARATFFVLLTAPYYNALSEHSLALLRRIAAMGHEIGLHYDCSMLEDLTPEAQTARIASLARCLADQLGEPIRSVAQHKPARARVRPTVPGYLDAYSDEFFRHMAYLSDSRMKFGTDDLAAFFAAHSRVQLVIHPIWWHAERRTREQILESVEELASALIGANARADLASIQEYFSRQRQ